ncbi:unnamed protein product, partial [Closterium sp. NIES-64]
WRAVVGGRAVVAGVGGGAVGGGRDGEEGVESREGRDGGKTGGDDRSDKGGKGLEKGGEPKQVQLHQQQLQVGGDTKHADVDNSTSPLHTMDSLAAARRRAGFTCCVRPHVKE